MSYHEKIQNSLVYPKSTALIAANAAGETMPWCQNNGSIPLPHSDVFNVFTVYLTRQC